MVGMYRKVSFHLSKRDCVSDFTLFVHVSMSSAVGGASLDGSHDPVELIKSEGLLPVQSKLNWGTPTVLYIRTHYI